MARTSSKLARITRGTLKFLAALVGVPILIALLVVVAALVYLATTPEIRIDTARADWIVFQAHAWGVWPRDLDVRYRDFELLIQRRGDLFSREVLQRRLALKVSGLHVGYAAPAVVIDANDASLALTAGRRDHGPNESAWGLIQIEPLKILGTQVAVDVPALPASSPKDKKPSTFDPLAFVTHEILPRWKYQTSAVEVSKLSLRLDPKTAYSGRLSLTAPTTGVELAVTEVRDLNGPLRAQLVLHALTEQSLNRVAIESIAWKLALLGDVNLTSAKRIELNANADISPATAKAPAQTRFDIETHFHGLAGLKRAGFEGTFSAPKLDGDVSLKMGSLGAQIRALDVVKCAVGFDLSAKTGGIKCGPETVRLRLAEHSVIREHKLYTVSPRMELKLTHVDFGATKRADATLHVDLNHFGIVQAESDVTGHYVGEPKQPARYSAEGTLHLGIAKFARIVDLLRETAFAVPAPLNSLHGQIGVNVSGRGDETSGSAQFAASTRLDSPEQAVHLNLDGKADLLRTAKGLTPKVDATLGIEALHLSAPRFELRVPPRLLPDSRFGPLKELSKDETDTNRSHQHIVAGAPSDHKVRAPHTDSEPMDFRLRILTTQPQAIRIATSVTKTPIPVDLNLVYDARKGYARPPATEDSDRSLASAIGRGTAVADAAGVNGTANTSSSSSGSTSGATTSARGEPGVGEVGDPASHGTLPTNPAKASPVSGYVIVGRTPLDLFRRNATVEEVRVDLLSSGENRITGDVNVSYLEYSIDMMISGLLNNPQLRFQSDPPLSDDQVLAVLLFGRPLNELGDDQKDSVGNLNAAFADAALGISSLYLLASTPIESIGYDPESSLVMARLGLGGGATLELGGGSDSSEIGVKKRLSHNFTLRSDVESVGMTGKKTVTALVEWIKRF